MFVDGSQVTQNITNEILQRVDVLSAKLGTTASHIWDVYVTQGKVEAIRDSVVLGICLIAATGLVLLAKSLHKKIENCCNNGEDELGYVIATVFTIILILFTVITGLVHGYDAVGEWLNPQYWAFQHLTMDLKNLF
jgi:hypothetical protein